MSSPNERYRIDNFHAKSLENNPLNSPVDRDINIYLPPGYFKDNSKRFPVIYYLHGYSLSNRMWTITWQEDENKFLNFNVLPPNVAEKIDPEDLLYFEKFDDLIENGDLDPFIFVQPDASLHLPQISGRKDLRGIAFKKGSYYINSPATGNYMDYIIYDIIDYIDNNYRTFPDKTHRALMGGSMGGYGALFLSLHHPDKFISVVALSPANIRSIGATNWKLRIPFYEEIFGTEMGNKIGDMAWADILDTQDLILSKKTPLIPSIKRDIDGNIMDYSREAESNWRKFDIIKLIREKPDALKKLYILFNCESTDEFGLTGDSVRLHETLLELNIDHEYEIYSDPKVALSPHIFGIGSKIMDGMRFCLKYF
ncbi:MAG: alpha/beta hydrolase-fold protein [Candidatus Hodarchaeota archaeon]